MVAFFAIRASIQWADLLALVKGEGCVWPAGMRQNAVRTARLACDAPADPQQRRHDSARVRRTPTASCHRNGEDLLNLRRALALLDALGQHAQA